MNCPKCGNELAPNTEICEKCKEAVAQPAPSAPQKQKKGKKNLALKITAIVLAVIVFLTGGLFITDAIIFSTESKKGDFVTDFPILKQKTDLLVYDAEKFPYENYNIKVDRFKTGKVFKSSTFSSFENIINEQSNNPIFSIDFKEDGKYQITLEGIVAERTQAVTESTTKKEEPKTIVIIVIVDNDNEKAVDKVTINSKKDDKPIKDLSELLSSQGNAGSQNITTIAAGYGHTVAVKTDGTVIAVGLNDQGQCDVGGWTDIIAVSVNDYNTFGLKSDGTVVAVGNNEYGQCNVSGWTDIVAISAGEYYLVGLKSDGTVVAVGENNYGECDVGEWTDIVDIAASVDHTVGLRSDGTVLAIGDNYFEQYDAREWTDIVDIAIGISYTMGLKSDGTVVVAGYNGYGQCDVGGWTDIVAVSAGFSYAVGIRSDGTVVAVGDNEYGQCNVGGWTDIVAVSAGGYHTVGLRPDGTAVAVGHNGYEQCNISGWKDIKVPGRNNSVSKYPVNENPELPTQNNEYVNSVYPDNSGVVNPDENIIVEDEFLFGKLDDGTWEVHGIRNCVTPNIVLPSSYQGIAVTKTSISAFQCQNEFLTVTIPGNIKVVDTSAFQVCENLTAVTFEEGVERLGDSTFQSCKSLSSVVIPRSMVDLGGSSFYGCDLLNTLYYGGNAEEWQSKFGDDFTFFDHSGHTTIYFYSDVAPTTPGNYWHYVNGVPAVW